MTNHTLALEHKGTLLKVAESGDHNSVKLALQDYLENVKDVTHRDSALRRALATHCKRDECPALHHLVASYFDYASKDVNMISGIQDAILARIRHGDPKGTAIILPFLVKAYDGKNDKALAVDLRSLLNIGLKQENLKLVNVVFPFFNQHVEEGTIKEEGRRNVSALQHKQSVGAVPRSFLTRRQLT